MALAPTSSSGGGASTSALTLLSTTTLAGVGTFDVSGISQSYNDLVLVGMLRGTAAGAADSPIVRFNNDSGANYTYDYMRASGSTPQAGEGLGQTSIQWALNGAPAATGATNGFGFLAAEVGGYASTTWVKTMTARNGGYSTIATGTLFPAVVCGIWNSTAAITRVQVLTGAGNNFAAGSVLRIYGRL